VEQFIESVTFAPGVVNFIQVNNLLSRIEVKSHEQFHAIQINSIPLLFELTDIDFIKKTLGSIKLKETISFDLFTMIVAGCIRVSMRPH
jgi:hypothetical protein